MEFNETDAQTYLERYGEHYSQDMVFQCLNKLPGQSLLDLGCGGGRVLRLALGSRRWRFILGLDPSITMTRAAYRHCRGSEGTRWSILAGRAEQIPCRDACFDVIVSSNTHYFWADQARVLREIWRVLVPGGSLALAEDDWQKHGLGPGQDVAITKPTFHRLLGEHGFIKRSNSLIQVGENRLAVVLGQKRP